jgi:hypothetical protein
VHLDSGSSSPLLMTLLTSSVIDSLGVSTTGPHWVPSSISPLPFPSAQNTHQSRSFTQLLKQSSKQNTSFWPTPKNRCCQAWQIHGQGHLN